MVYSDTKSSGDQLTSSEYNALVDVFSIFGKDEFTGADFSGSDGDASRTVSLTNTNTVDYELVYVDGLLLTDTDGTNDDYGVSTASSAATLTVNIDLFDDQKVVIFYFQGVVRT